MRLITRRRWQTSAAATLAVGLVLTGCGGSSKTGTTTSKSPTATSTGSATTSESPSSAPAKNVTLKVSLFGKFGYIESGLYTAYEAAHPGIKIVETSEGDLGKYNTALTTKIAAGQAPGDVVAIEEGTLTQFLPKPESFVNLLDHGAAALKANWLDWKWNQSLAKAGTYQIGLGTDVGGLAMCYRSDLFKAAGLPTNRDAVSALWPTWDAFIATGKTFAAGNKNPKVHFLDSATNVYNSILMQQSDHTYFDKTDKLVIDSNPGVKKAWDIAVQITDAKLSAKLKSFSNEWNAGFKNASFATIACPAWMAGYIQGQATSAAGKWDIAKVPGGGGNWGGSFLAIPAKSTHQAEAAELIKFLTSPESQLAVFKKVGNLPSVPKLYTDPAVLALKNPYFSNAPVGEIFAAGAASLKPLYLGAKNQPVRDAVENALRTVEQGQRSSDAGWQQAIKDAKRAAGQ